MSFTRPMPASKCTTAESVWSGRPVTQTTAGSTAQSGTWNLFGSTSSSASASGSTRDLWNFNVGTPAVQDLQAGNPIPALTGVEVTDLREVLRFDITPQWVPQRFSRVSTVLADLNMDGLRVPLVTGTGIGDLAGTLTYYFDRYQRLQRVNIHGLTGDPAILTAQLQQYYHLQQEPSLGGGLYLIKWNGKPTSVLHIAPAPVIYSSAEHSRYTVFLELNQPDIPFGLSPEAVQLIHEGRVINRW
ncbi:MAG: DUF6690 family protein [Pirellulales bacterium]